MGDEERASASGSGGVSGEAGLSRDSLKELLKEVLREDPSLLAKPTVEGLSEKGKAPSKGEYQR